MADSILKFECGENRQVTVNDVLSGQIIVTACGALPHIICLEDTAGCAQGWPCLPRCISWQHVVNKQGLKVACTYFFLDYKRKIWTWTGIRTSDLQITSLALLPIKLSKFPFQYVFKRLASVWHLSFQEERLNMNWNGNLDSSIGKSARQVIWRSVVRIPVQVRFFSLEI